MMRRFFASFLLLGVLLCNVGLLPVQAQDSVQTTESTRSVDVDAGGTTTTTTSYEPDTNQVLMWVGAGLGVLVIVALIAAAAGGGGRTTVIER